MADEAKLRSPIHSALEALKLRNVQFSQLIVMIPILINKDVFEPSYNDLNFTV